jgi:hypothetical protein
MTRKLILAIAAMLGSCSAGDSQSLDDQANDLIDWSRRNPPVSEATWRGVGKLVCRPELLDVCGSKACLARKLDGKPPVIISWNPGSGEYQRCDPKGGGCDTYQPSISYAGSFMHAALPSNGIMFWLTASGEYREIANMRTDTYVYRGKCSRE